MITRLREFFEGAPRPRTAALVCIDGYTTTIGTARMGVGDYVSPRVYDGKRQMTETQRRSHLSAALRAINFIKGEQVMTDEDQAGARAEAASADMQHRTMTAEEPAPQLPKARLVSDADAAAFAAADKAMTADINRRSRRALTLNAWVRQMQVHRGPSFMIGPGDVQALELAERAIEGVPQTDPGQ